MYIHFLNPIVTCILNFLYSLKSVFEADSLILLYCLLIKAVACKMDLLLQR